MYPNNVTKIIKTPNITVIVPLYNKALEIRRCIDSILSQTYSDFELIIVDGGSTDGSLDIVRTYTDSRLRIINQRSKGVAAGRNEGIHASNTELIAFLDADDEWMPIFLEIIMHLRKKYPDAGMYGTAGYAALGGSYQIANYRENSGEIWDGYIPYITNATFNGPGISMSGVAIPKNVFETVCEFDENLRWFEDVALFGRIAYKYPVVYSTIIGYIYYFVSSNKITDAKPMVLDSHPLIDYYESILCDDTANKEKYDEIQLYVQKLYLSLAGMHLLAEDTMRVRKNLTHVHSPQFKKTKLQYVILSYFPHPILGILRKYNSRRLYWQIYIRNHIK